MFLAYHWVFKYDKTWILLKQVQTCPNNSSKIPINGHRRNSNLFFHNSDSRLPGISQHFPTFPDISRHFLTFPAEFFWRECWEIGGLFCGEDLLNNILNNQYYIILNMHFYLGPLDRSPIKGLVIFFFSSFPVWQKITRNDRKRIFFMANKYLI